MPSSRYVLFLFFICISLLTAGCAGIGTGYETPEVTVSSFKTLPGQGAAPRFEIGLHILNPNRVDLELEGVAYTVSIEGYKILAGVSNDLPVIEAYGEGEILLTATVSLFNSIAFFADLAGKDNPDELSYSFDAKLDVGSFRPIIRVSKSGTLSLGSIQ